ncbi:MAG: FtsX-like permease family protein [Solirubrobacterales bacterium]|nr:FtsX-like permease family protein [Solirubrobacterales bacterium]
MFYLEYLFAEVGRRPGRTALTALGLAVGVGLVVIVGALSAGLDDAQDEVLEPLAGVGTDLSVSRPIAVPDDDSAAAGSGDPFERLSGPEQRRLQRENREHNREFNFAELGEPGERFSEDSFLSTELSFPTSKVAKIRDLDGAEGAAASLTLNATHVEGVVPEGGAAPLGAGAHGPGGGGFGGAGGFEFESLPVSGVDVRKPDLAVVTPDQVTTGRYLSETPKRARGEAVVDLAFARQNDIGVGDETEVAGEEFTVVGLASAPLGGDASNVYVELGRLQELSDREGRVNAIQVRADSADAVARLEDGIAERLPGADVVTAADLADRVGGSLDDADDLSSKLGTALAVVALLAAFLIAALLTLSSVQKRTRELGTLKALGWRQRLVVRQVAGESLVQGAIGGLLGAAIGIAGAAIIDAIGPTLEASVEGQPGAGFGPFGQGDITAGSTDVVLGAPVDVGLLLVAVGLAIVGGLLAGVAGGLRAARLRPAEALRSAE